MQLNHEAAPTLRVTRDAAPAGRRRRSRRRGQRSERSSERFRCSGCCRRLFTTAVFAPPLTLFPVLLRTLLFSCRATTGYFLQEFVSLPNYPGYSANPVEAFSSVPPEGLLQIVLFMGWLEVTANKVRAETWEQHKSTPARLFVRWKEQDAKAQSGKRAQSSQTLRSGAHAPSAVKRSAHAESVVMQRKICRAAPLLQSAATQETHTATLAFFLAPHAHGSTPTHFSHPLLPPLLPPFPSVRAGQVHDDGHVLGWPHPG